MKHTHALRPCEQCGQLFENYKHPNARFCSLACFHKSCKTRETRICAYCGAEFEVLRAVEQKCCSQSCGARARTQRPRRQRKSCVCEWCNKAFETWSSRPGRFCSRKCAAQYGARQPRPNTRKPEIHVNRNCKICHKPYETTTHQIRLRGSSCCSVECANILRSQIKQGAGNPNYRGGTVRYRGANWGRQERKALKRDGYRCQICHKQLGRKTHDYGVHHIKPFREFGGDYLAANQLSNLITLCRRCHGKVEAGKLACPTPLPI